MDVAKKLTDYENFIDDTLKRDLRLIEVQLDQTVRKYEGWESLSNTVKMLKSFKDRELNLLVPLGRGVNVNASTDDYDNLLIDVGLGCLLEMNYAEAEKYAAIRMRALKKEIDHYRRLAVHVKVQIKVVLLGINELRT